MDVYEFMRRHFPDNSSLISRIDRSSHKSEVYSKLKQAVYKRELLKINYMLNNHVSLRTVRLKDIQKLIYRVFKDSKGIHLQQSLVVDTLRLLHAKGANLNVKNRKQRTVLQLAIERRLTQVIDFLISCKVNLYDSFGNSILHFLIVSEASKFANEMHGKKKVSQNYLTPVKKQSIDFINWMLLKDVNVDCQNNNGDTALHLAAKYNLLHALPLLLNHSRNVAIRNNSGINAFQILLNSVTNFTENPKNEEISLQSGTFIPINCFESDFVDEIYKIFVSKGCSIDIADNNGYTPMHRLLMQHRSKLAKLMSDYFTNVNARDKDGNTVLHIAMNNLKHAQTTYADYRDIVRTLVSNGANINQMNNNGVSPLIAAVVDHRETLLEVFTEHGADLRYQHKGQNLLHYICKSKIKMDDKSCREAFNFLMNKGCNVNAKDFQGKTPLHYAARYARTKTIEALIACGANVNVRESIDGYTPLHEAVKSDREKLLTVLLKNGADVNATANNGETALSLAKNSKKNVSDTLIKLGACIDVEDDNRFLPSLTSFIHEGYQMIEKLRFGDEHNDDVHILYDKKNASACKSVTEHAIDLDAVHQVFNEKSNDDVHVVYDKKNASISKSVTGQSVKLDATCQVSKGNYKDDVHVVCVKNNATVSKSVNRHATKLKNTHQGNEKSRKFLTEAEIWKSCADNHSKSLYYLMHINRNTKCFLSVRAKDLQKLSKTTVVKQLLAKTWQSKAKKSPRLSKRHAMLMSKKC